MSGARGGPSLGRWPRRSRCPGMSMARSPSLSNPSLHSLPRPPKPGLCSALCTKSQAGFCDRKRDSCRRSAPPCPTCRRWCCRRRSRKKRCSHVPAALELFFQDAAIVGGLLGLALAVIDGGVRPVSVIQTGRADRPCLSRTSRTERAFVDHQASQLADAMGVELVERTSRRCTRAGWDRGRGSWRRCASSPRRTSGPPA